MSKMFKQPTIDEQHRYREYLSRCTQKTSDYSFANIFGWAVEHGLTWHFDEHCVWIRQEGPKPVFWAPVGDWEGIDWANLQCLTPGMTITRAPEALVMLLRDSLGERIEITPAREHWDYVYKVDNMISLDNERLRRKRELLDEFRKSYDFVYKPIDQECIEEALEMQEQWVHWHECEDCEALIAENNAIARVLQDWDSIDGLMGAALHVDGHIVAYTVAEELDPKTLVVHFEKGKPEFNGVYQAINQMFLDDMGKDYIFVNREQDLDEPGLRKAKLSYDPFRFMKKYVVKVK